MGQVSESFFESGGLLCRALYRASGLQGAMSALLDTAREFIPVVRINALYVPQDFSSFVNIIDTLPGSNLKTIFRSPGKAVPFLLPDRITEPLIIGQLDEFKVEAYLNDPDFSQMPFLHHRALVRLPLFQTGHSIFLINFWSDTPNCFTGEDLSHLQVLTAPLSEELRSNFSPVIDITSGVPPVYSGSPFERLRMCPHLEPLCRQLTQVARTSSTVLIQGETGVGKEAVAAAVHELSACARGPFVPVNCGAIPDTLMDSELFGHERGAFTGAGATRAGLFEQADGGTLLLDEVGDMPLAAQVRLLRVMETGTFTRVGGMRPISVRVRIVAATHVNLAQQVQEGRFRKDLWFRLSVFPLTVPPLRQRKADIAVLVKHFIVHKAQELGLPAPTHVPGAELDRLYAYEWPGNIRELEHVIERSLILHSGQVKAPLRFDFGEQLETGPRVERILEDWPTLNELENRYIRAVLQRVNGKMTGTGSATELLGIHYTTLRQRMVQQGLPLPRSGSEAKLAVR